MSSLDVTQMARVLDDDTGSCVTRRHDQLVDARGEPFVNVANT